jgi:beta-1,4-mannosyl-glycoprotein beta-1,4-N-acetylglucosaminyltransferase
MKIYDCTIFFDENFLLEIRFNILDKVVDYFVVVESNKTWQNNLKTFNFDFKRFEKFLHKIIYIKVEDMPSGNNPWIRENFQRDCIMRGLYNAKDDDLIIISDADEIPNPVKIYDFNFQKKYCVLEQKLFYYKLNILNETYPNWYGSKICVKKYLKSPQWLRNLKIKKRPFWRIDKLHLNYVIFNGGWHFSNLKSPKELLYKYRNLCEYKDDYVFFNRIDEKFLEENVIKYNIDNKLDLLGRNCQYKKINIDNSFPDYIYRNKEKFKDWID